MINYIIVMIVILIPIVVAGLISDLTYKNVILFLGFPSSIVAIAALDHFNIFTYFYDWMGQPAHFLFFGLAVLAVSVTAARANKWRSERITSSLAWGENLSADQFEKRCFSYLKSNGWKTSHNMLSIAGLRVVRVQKQNFTRFIVFVTVDVGREILHDTIKKYHREIAWGIVFVFYNKSIAEKYSGFGAVWPCLHYSQLQALSTTPKSSL